MNQTFEPFPGPRGAAFVVALAQLAGLSGQTYSAPPKTLPPNAIYLGAILGPSTPIALRNPAAFTSPSGASLTMALVLTPPSGPPVTLASATVGQVLDALPIVAPDSTFTRGTPIGGWTATLTIADLDPAKRAVVTSGLTAMSDLAGTTLVVGTDAHGPFSVPLGSPGGMSNVKASIDAATGGVDPNAFVLVDDDPGVIRFTAQTLGGASRLTFSGSAAAPLSLAPSYSGANGEALSAVLAGYLEGLVLYDNLVRA